MLDVDTIQCRKIIETLLAVHIFKHKKKIKIFIVKAQYMISVYI